MEKNLLAKIVSIILKVMFIGGACCLFVLPILYNLFKYDSVPSFSEQSNIYKIAFYLCFIICLIIIFILNRLFSDIYIDTPFKKKIETYLNVIATLFIILSLIVLIKTVFIPTI